MEVSNRHPSLFDYFAGGVLTNGITAMWGYVITSLPIIALTALPVYCLSSALSAYFVCQRTSKQHLIVGAKTAIVAFFVGLFLFMGLTDLNIGSLILLLICYLIGGVGGSYFALKKQGFRDLNN